MTSIHKKRRQMHLHKHLFTTIFILLLVISTGAYAYHTVEGWSYLDSTYFVIITITTIGYGDLVPQTATGKIFTMFFSFIGIAMALYFLSIISTNLFKKHLGRKVGEIKKETKKQEDMIKGESKKAKSKKSKKSKRKSKKKR
ncbi:two pore domain potassium channel family protein [Candidatus Pacearchaeota archaeon]|nr:two pore domain potassium channel family protein [Candidatus Pacearchaeota archaeon]